MASADNTTRRTIVDFSNPVEMDAETLLEHLNNGYTLHTFWMYGKLASVIRKDGNPSICIDNLAPAQLERRGIIKGVELDNGSWDYYLAYNATDEEQYFADFGGE